MRIQPRQQLLESWRAVARTSFQKGTWVWEGRRQRNSISDAEQLLCLMGPATEVPTFKLDQPNETAEDVERALEVLGDSVEVPQRLVHVIHEYLTTYIDEDGRPTFGGGSYFTAIDDEREPTEAQRSLDVVDSFAISIRLTLAIIGFAKVFRRVLTRQQLRDDVRRIEELASQRLTGAMIGLMRSFTVYVLDPDSPEGTNLLQMINQSRQSRSRIRQDFQTGIEEIRAGLRDVTFGLGEVPDLDNDNKVFECGWSWGITKGAPRVDTSAEGVLQPVGYALAAPYAYFTAVALDCMQHLFSERTRLLGLLDDEQQRLARALQIRYDLTLSYWSTIARFGDERWPLENVPWMTVDGSQSDYLSLLVSSMVVLDMSVNRVDNESDPVRIGQVLEELAERSRITRRPISDDDPALALHLPGFPFQLDGSEEVGGPMLNWELADFSTQLLKQTLRVAGLINRVDQRNEMTNLVDEVWEHVTGRRIEQGPAAGLWDQPSAIYPALPPSDEAASWYYSERVISCLVAAANLIDSPPLRSPGLINHATQLLAEADHIYDQELLRISADSGPSMREALKSAGASLRRAHDVIRIRPGTAAALAAQVLVDLDRLSAARRDASGAR
ncbi:SCO2524 family protein [Dactylosporangium sp. NPDC005572]|uniref:SCO2524 family protein n=1 Tax=Dactylosporangium sp. NPDC005572 TaxID=3156889 RepID=UPI0033BCDDD9